MTGTIYADIVPTGTPASIGFNCNTDMTFPISISSDSSYIYALNNNGTVTRYDIATGIEDETTGGAFSCSSGFTHAAAILVYGGYIYICENSTGRISKFTASTGTVYATNFIANPALGNGPTGMCTDGTYLYVTHPTYLNGVARYVLATGALASTGFSIASAISTAQGICTDGTYLYVVSNSAQKVYRYNMNGSIAVSGFLCNTGMNSPRDIIIDNSTPGGPYLCVANSGTTGTNANTVTKYNIGSGTQIPSATFNCNINMNSPYGLTTNSTYLYVSNYISAGNITRYDISTGAFDNSGPIIPGISIHDYEQNINFVANVWQQYYVTFNVGTPLGSLSTNPSAPDYFAIGIIPNVSILNATPAYTFAFTQAQLEYGKSPTAFGVKTISEEELLCQRYFQTSYIKDITPGTINQNRIGSVNCLAGTGTIAGTSNACLLTYILLVPKMRIAPTVTLYAPAAGTAGSIETDSTHPHAITPTIYASDGAITDIVATTNTSTIPALDNAGEWFQFHYTADAEL